MSQPRVLVVAKWSAYRRYVETRRDSLTLRLMAENDPSVADFKSAHLEHESTLRDVLEVLRALDVRLHVIKMPHQPFSARGASLVITVGGDGTLLAASHQLNGDAPILGINSAPSTSVGFFCALKAGPKLRKGIEKAVLGGLPSVNLARMEVRLNRKVVSRRVLNDALFCHASPAATSRYIVQLGKLSEQHKSSGFWIGPAAGSTAAQHSAGGNILPLRSRDLQLVVREPFLFTGALQIANLRIHEGTHLHVLSKMREAKLFLDGPHTVIDVGLGDRLRFSLSKEPLTVLGLTRRRR